MYPQEERARVDTLLVARSQESNVGEVVGWQEHCQGNGGVNED